MTSTLSETAYLLPRAFFSSFLLIFLGIVVQSFKKRKYPPGPRGLPVLGNVFQLEEKIWIPFNRWKIQFGPIVYLNVFGKPLVILNTYEAAADLLDKRSNIYSDRAPNIVVRDHLTGGNGMAWMDYSDLWRRMYQVSHDALHKNAVKLYHGIQNTEALIWIQALFREPERSQVHTRRLGTSLVSSVIYGPPPLKSANDPAIALINEHGERMTIAALPFTHLVDFIPALRHLPSRMVKWKRDAEYWYEKDSRMHETMCNEAKQRSAARGNQPTLVDGITANQEKLGLTERQAAWLASLYYAAGAESTASALQWFLLAMVLRPDVQTRAQAEIDVVVGQSQLLRWTSVAPVGIPHRCAEDDWYNGYFIPKGTICIPNVMGMNKDPAVWGPDAQQFNPQGHLDKDGRLAQAPVNTKEESHATFGFGPRTCPGRHLANNSLFFSIASILWASHIRPARDKGGKEIVPDPSQIITGGLVIRPAPFECSVVPRFPHTEALLAEALEESGY